ncbi:MAG: dienelactone hydrolase family protein, partial [Actinomycetota bacterium]
MSSDVLNGWEKGSFAAAGITRDTYRKGSGPLVIVVHEVPGITPKVTAFANEVVAQGFTVVMPDLVGTPGKEVSGGYALASLTKVCVSKEFSA